MGRTDWKKGGRGVVSGIYTRNVSCRCQRRQKRRGNVRGTRHIHVEQREKRGRKGLAVLRGLSDNKRRKMEGRELRKRNEEQEGGSGREKMILKSRTRKY